MTAERAHAIEALGDLPCASELVGLALDFATDLACERARYLGPAHSAKMRVMRCRNRLRHMLCETCNPAKECDNGCEEIVCTACNEARPQICSACDEIISACFNPLCLYQLKCCRARVAETAVLCAKCYNNQPACYKCYTRLCANCDTTCACCNLDCGTFAYACELHTETLVEDSMWDTCPECNALICTVCTRAGVRGLCTDCAKLHSAKRKAES